MKENESIKKWQESGLLEGLSDEFKAIVAQQLQITENEITKDTFKNKLSVLAFPITRRIGQKVGNELDVPHMLNKLQEMYNKEGWIMETSLNQIPKKGDSDPEVMFCSTFCENYYNEFHNPKSKSINEEKKRWAILSGIVKS